jgi:hypothetical protein
VLNEALDPTKTAEVIWSLSRCNPSLKAMVKPEAGQICGSCLVESQEG